MRNRHCNCGCQKPTNEIVYPVKNEVVDCYSEETVKHVHPSHTTVKNHHTIKNEHVYPHTTSVENIVNNVDINNGRPNNNQVAGATSPNNPTGSGNKGCKPCNPCNHHHHHRRRRRGFF